MERAARVVNARPTITTPLTPHPAKPVHYEFVRFGQRQGAASDADSPRIDVVIALEFLELQTGMPCVAIPNFLVTRDCT